MAATGTPDCHPVRVGPATLDYGTGAQAAFAIAAALFQRSRTGRGQRIDDMAPHRLARMGIAPGACQWRARHNHSQHTSCH